MAQARIAVSCPNCGRRGHANSAVVGRTLKCRCGHSFVLHGPHFPLNTANGRSSHALADQLELWGSLVFVFAFPCAISGTLFCAWWLSQTWPERTEFLWFSVLVLPAILLPGILLSLTLRWMAHLLDRSHSGL